MPPRIALWIVIVTLGTAGCGTEPRDAGPIRSDDRPDMGETIDLSMSHPDDPDVGDDEPDPADDAGPDEMGDGGGDPEDLPTGIMCGYDDLEPFRGLCDPVRVEGCTEPDACLPAVAIMGPDSILTAACVESDVHVLEEGENCDGTIERCAPGLLCITLYGECRRLCYPDTALGCAESQFCRRPSRTWEGLGFCDDTCNL